MGPQQPLTKQLSASPPSHQLPASLPTISSTTAPWQDTLHTATVIAARCRDIQSQLCSATAAIQKPLESGSLVGINWAYLSSDEGHVFWPLLQACALGREALTKVDPTQRTLASGTDSLRLAVEAATWLCGEPNEVTLRDASRMVDTSCEVADKCRFLHKLAGSGL